MFKNETISAVLFVYNEQEFISATLDSILNQSVTVDEIIIVDDFSTDNTRDIIQSYSSKFNHIYLFLNSQKGKIHAYQNALNKVKTDYFFVFGGDDVLKENHVINMITLLKSKNLKYAYANYVMTNSSLKPFKFKKKKEYYTLREMLDYNYVSGCIFGHSSIIKEITPLPKGLLFEDWYTSIKLSFLYHKNYISKEPLLYYRRHPNATTANFKTKEKFFYHLDRHIGLFEIIIEENFIYDKDYLKIINSKLKFLKVLRYYTFSKALNSFFDFNLTFKERFKLILFPIYFTFRYH